MSPPENIFQEWLWKGLGEGKFHPEGDMSFDEHDNDVLIGKIYLGEDTLEVSALGPTIEASGIPEVLIATMPGRQLKEIIILPPCGNDKYDALVNEAIINDIKRNGSQITLEIGSAK